MEKIKIAIPTYNGRKISPHYGRSKYFYVYTIENGGVVGKEIREKPDFTSGTLHSGRGHGGGMGRNQGGRGGGNWQILNLINDCDYVIGGEMGEGAYRNLLSSNLKVILTDVRDIEEALKKFLEGDLENNPGLLQPRRIDR